MLEKECYAIIATAERMHWLLAIPDGFDLFSDHHKIFFTFDPLSIMPDLSQSSVKEVWRRTVRMTIYNYTCLHIKGPQNVLADLLGRWSSSSTRVRCTIKIPVLPFSSSKEFDWAPHSEIAGVQNELIYEKPTGLRCKNGIWINENDVFRIPEKAADLQLRICIAAHRFLGGHRGAFATEISFRKHFFLEHANERYTNIFRGYIHRLSTEAG